MSVRNPSKAYVTLLKEGLDCPRLGSNLRLADGALRRRPLVRIVASGKWVCACVKTHFPEATVPYDTGKHTVYYHLFHIVWITKYRYKVLRGALRERVRDIIRQVCEELGVTIVNGVLSSDHVHMFVSIPPKLCVSDVVRRVKGRSSSKIQQEFPDIRKRYWGCRFWARGYFCTTSGNVLTTSYSATSKATLPNLPASAGSRLAWSCDVRRR